MGASIDREFIARQRVIRRAILAVLYEKRRTGQNGYWPDLTYALGHASEECSFALEFLEELELVHRDPKSCRITAQGINHFEQETPA
ncbi:hypothetical protein [Pseudomonas sp. WS 5079]|uniref:hypothetical protein n=1 Tax=Pseudomonas sp. WS 5079 TaxID=2717492 RepID=UPI001553E78F|nr:hypothetical protein [Pseudomonas sp. WS 5079]NMX60198.1 hypothetical protein [Pseudomonas sp. WS 5079]